MTMHKSIGAATAVARLEIVTTPERLAAVGERWTRLWRERDGLIFQSHDWISAWVKALRNPDRVGLRIGLAWHGDRLVAVVPLAITRRRGLRFLEWAAVAYSDYGDILCAPECGDATLDALWAAICDAGGFDLAFINRLLPEAAARRVFAPGRTVGTRLRADSRQEISYRVSCGWESGDAWVAARSKGTRKSYRRSVKRLEEIGTMRLRLIGPDEPFEEILDRMAALKRKWLEKTGRSSDLFDEGAPMLKALVAVLARARALHMFMIEVDGAMAAISVGFVQRNVWMDWVATHDPDLARASPGLVQIFECVQWAIDNGIDTVDLLCGGEAFKERVASHAVTLDVLVGARSAKGRLALFVDGIRRKLRQRRKAEAACADTAASSAPDEDRTSFSPAIPPCASGPEPSRRNASGDADG